MKRNCLMIFFIVIFLLPGILLIKIGRCENNKALYGLKRVSVSVVANSPIKNSCGLIRDLIISKIERAGLKVQSASDCELVLSIRWFPFGHENKNIVGGYGCVEMYLKEPVIVKRNNASVIGGVWRSPQLYFHRGDYIREGLISQASEICDIFINAWKRAQPRNRQ